MSEVKQFWMVFVEGGYAPNFKHPTYQSAKTEVERLARMMDNQGNNIFILVATDCCVYNPFQWTNLQPVEIESHDIPF